MEANQRLRTKFSSSASSTIEDVDVTNKDLLASVDRECFCDITLIMHVSALYPNRQRK